MEYAIALAIMVPISIVILIASMFISSSLGGGIEFGEAHIVIPKAAVLLLVVNALSFVRYGVWIALPVWWFGLMVLFELDFWECRILVFVNWALNFVARFAVIGILSKLVK